jgi:hypothetical protein
MSAVNLIALPEALVEGLAWASAPAPVARRILDGRGLLIDGVLTAPEVEALLEELAAHEWQPVGLDGIASHHKEGEQVGSWRATVDSEGLAAALWARLEPSCGGRLDLTGSNTTDHGDHPLWEPVGLNPRLRLIRYEQGGLLVPHYDAPYGDGEDEITLRTVVLYLGISGEATGGATRFLHDPSLALPYEERDFSDWERLAREDEVRERVSGTGGQALVFDHRLLHDSEPLRGAGTKTIIRTDIAYRRVR